MEHLSKKKDWMCVRISGFERSLMIIPMSWQVHLITDSYSMWMLYVFTGDFYMTKILTESISKVTFRGLECKCTRGQLCKKHFTIWACCVQITRVCVWMRVFVFVLMHTINVWNFKPAFCLKTTNSSQRRIVDIRALSQGSEWEMGNKAGHLLISTDQFTVQLVETMCYHQIR